MAFKYLNFILGLFFITIFSSTSTFGQVQKRCQYRTPNDLPVMRRSNFIESQNSGLCLEIQQTQNGFSPLGLTRCQWFRPNSPLEQTFSFSSTGLGMVLKPERKTFVETCVAPQQQQQHGGNNGGFFGGNGGGFGGGSRPTIAGALTCKPKDNNQIWKFNQIGRDSVYQVENLQTRRCLSVPKAAGGVQVQTVACNRLDRQQQWRICNL